jgi:hypothetical protein
MKTIPALNPRTPGTVRVADRRQFAFRFLAAICLLWFLVGCTPLRPVETADEFTPPASAAPLWDEIAHDAPDDWHVLLDRGVDALDWRLRSMDSATQSIDLQTFLCSADVVGGLVPGYGRWQGVPAWR